MRNSYIEINKVDLMLVFAWAAAVFAYYAWKEASAARYASNRDLEPITVGGDVDANDQDDSEDDE